MRGPFQSILQSTGNRHSLTWPITFKYRLLLEDFHDGDRSASVQGIVHDPEYLYFGRISLGQQFFVMDKLREDALSIQDTHSLSRVEQYLCLHYKTEFPGIEKIIPDLGDESHQSEDQVQEILR